MDSLEIRPLTARSVVLSTLLGVHPPRLPARYLVRVGELFGIAEGTIRVALSRMVTAGDLVQSGGTYALTERLLERQARQDEARLPRPGPGTAPGRSPSSPPSAVPPPTAPRSARPCRRCGSPSSARAPGCARPT
ncbi:hypothetical protein [Actinomadura madurae]|uniref:hypothetical protein n=1 Tax=Actinomadura madurae TaxID=1993 RepID=UPI0020D2074D|nr:hypothetical protein [Actinomadura madurae]MCP9969263.1 hypothetical protein [Actinomadura madurae]MCQ0006745.1 hypothetical protein [Actinomadura madurae]MCQ0017947.1 hypothetical protein [Actinomadura madurae]